MHPQQQQFINKPCTYSVGGYSDSMQVRTCMHIYTVYDPSFHLAT